jgi:hypothetical protein
MHGKTNRDIFIEVIVNFTLILLGSFIAINLSTILGQTGDWGMLASGIITASMEITSKIIYKIKRKVSLPIKNKDAKAIKKAINLCNNLKLGLLYGFFVEAFKLGS